MRRKNMARKKFISDEKLIDNFEHYLEEQCNSNIRLFKIPQFGDYLRKNGFPNVADTTIRRNKPFRDILESKKLITPDEDYQVIITYKTLDVDSFMMTNRTPSSVKAALVELSQYYKGIVEAATNIKSENDTLRKELEKVTAQLREEYSDKLAFDKVMEEKVQLESENKKLQNILKTSVYPEIANELLKAEGLLKADKTVITDEFLANHIITSDTKINFSVDEMSSFSKPENKVVSIKNLLDSKTKY